MNWVQHWVSRIGLLVSNVALLPCQTQFINYEYIRMHLKVCWIVSLFLRFVFGNSHACYSTIKFDVWNQVVLVSCCSFELQSSQLSTAVHYVWNRPQLTTKSIYPENSFLQTLNGEKNKHWVKNVISVLIINSFFLDYWHNVSHLIHLIFASLSFPDFL